MNLADYIKAAPHGTAADWARELGVIYGQVGAMITGRSPISPARCIIFERLTGGKVSRLTMRPDAHLIWPELAAEMEQQKQKSV